MVTIAFAGGGTGGHIYPGLAVAEEMSRRFPAGEIRIFWIGSGNGRDRALVEGAGLEFFSVPAGKLRRHFSLKNMSDVFRVVAGYFAARKILKKRRPVLLFSKGGYVSVPPCAAAASLGIPVFTHESDFSPGLATRLNLRFAARTGGRCFISYQQTAGFFPDALRHCAVLSGNPVRRVFREADAEKGRAFLKLPSDARILLVLGGSQGAREINELVRAALPELCRHYTVVHQTGDAEWGVPASERYLPFPYIYGEMPHVLKAAELVLGRAGAGTLWECAAQGKPMLLVPLRGAGTRGDQVENARYFEQAGAAVCLCGDDAAPQRVAEIAGRLAGEPAARAAMEAASREIGLLDGAAAVCSELAGYIAAPLMQGSGRRNDICGD